MRLRTQLTRHLGHRQLLLLHLLLLMLLPLLLQMLLVIAPLEVHWLPWVDLLKNSSFTATLCGVVVGFEVSEVRETRAKDRAGNGVCGSENTQLRCHADVLTMNR